MASAHRLSTRLIRRRAAITTVSRDSLVGRHGHRGGPHPLCVAAAAALQA